MKPIKSWSVIAAAIFIFAAPCVAMAQGAPSNRALVVSTCGAQAFPLTDPSGRNAYAPLTELQTGILCTVGGSGGGGSAADQTGSNASDGQATSATNQHALAFLYAFNGTTWDRVRATSGVISMSDATTQSILNSIKTVLGSPFQAGGNIGNTGFNALQGGAATSLTNPLFVQMSQGGAALSATNGLPTTDTNASQTIAAPGSAASKAQAVQGPAGGAVPVSEADGQNTTLGSKSDTATAAPGNSLIAVERQLHADLIAPTPAGTFIIGKVGIDQTTPGTTNKVSIGSDGTVTANLGTLNGAATAANQTLTSGPVAPGTAASNSALAGLIYNSTAPTVASGQQVAQQADAAGNTKVNIATLLPAFASNPTFIPSVGTAAGTPLRNAEVGSSTAGDAITPVVTQSGTSIVGKASQGNLYSAYAVNTTTTAGYLACINATAAPAAGGAIAPVDVMSLPGSVGGQAQINYGAGPGDAYSTGIVCLVTTSLTTYTAGGAAFMNVRVR